MKNEERINFVDYVPLRIRQLELQDKIFLEHLTEKSSTYEIMRIATGEKSPRQILACDIVKKMYDEIFGGQNGE